MKLFEHCNHSTLQYHENNSIILIVALISHDTHHIGKPLSFPFIYLLKCYTHDVKV